MQGGRCVVSGSAPSLPWTACVVVACWDTGWGDALEPAEQATEPALREEGFRPLRLDNVVRAGCLGGREGRRGVTLRAHWGHQGSRSARMEHPG